MKGRGEKKKEREEMRKERREREDRLRQGGGVCYLTLHLHIPFAGE